MYIRTSIPSYSYRWQSTTINNKILLSANRILNDDSPYRRIYRRLRRFIFTAVGEKIYRLSPFRPRETMLYVKWVQRVRNLVINLTEATSVAGGAVACSSSAFRAETDERVNQSLHVVRRTVGESNVRYVRKRNYCAWIKYEGKRERTKLFRNNLEEKRLLLSGRPKVFAGT